VGIRPRRSESVIKSNLSVLGEFMNSYMAHNHDSCYEVYTNSYIALSGAP